MENSIIISVDSAVKKFKEHTALNNVSLQFECGKIYGIVGRNGSGKTVLFKCICGLTTPTSGSVCVNGKTIGKDTDIPQNIGVIIETPGFLPNYSGFKNLKFLAMIKNKITNSTAAYSTIANADLLVNGNYLLYFLLLAVTRGLIGSFLSLIALWVSVKIQNIFVINAAPLLIYYFVQNVAMNIISLPDFLNIANIFDGEITVIDSRYMTLYSVLFAVGLSVIIGFFAARGIEKKAGGE